MDLMERWQTLGLLLVLLLSGCLPFVAYPGAGEAAFRSGMEAYRQGNLERALVELSRAIEWLPVGDPRLEVAYQTRASIYIAKEDYERAIPDLNFVLLRNPRPEYYLLRAYAYLGKGDLDRAIADYDRVIQLKPNEARAHLGRGIAYYRKSNFSRARADLQRFLEIAPKDDPYVPVATRLIEQLPREPQENK